jgi:hypothetical protein
LKKKRNVVAFVPEAFSCGEAGKFPDNRNAPNQNDCPQTHPNPENDPGVFGYLEGSQSRLPLRQSICQSTIRAAHFRFRGYGQSRLTGQPGNCRSV